MKEDNNKTPQCLLFFSWESDRKGCRNFISSVINKLPGNVSDIASVIVDRDTANVPGSPDIGGTVFEKIQKCDLFIADVTIINEYNSGCRLTPNPNVMIEVGYAISSLGWDRIILLQCEDYGDIKDLPFDINHRRVSSFSLGIGIEDEKEKAERKRQSKQGVLDDVRSSIQLLKDKNMLFAGMKGRVPKFELTLYHGSICLESIVLRITNVSSVIVSCLQSRAVKVQFADGSEKELQCQVQFRLTALMGGATTDVFLNNPILGIRHGPDRFDLSEEERYNAWSNFDLIWHFCCENEEGMVFEFEMKRHIDNSKGIIEGPWPVRYIGV